MADNTWRAGGEFGVGWNALTPGAGLVENGGTISVSPSVGRLYAPLVNGDLPGPTLMVNGSGCCIMVPIT